ncbi:hypothetical protein HK105_201647 [Polyrhizophydium stewartii]|uniref:Uncharacterized protein n=1 Tax=Polyrhizophydium stewartii TaxID=2732419 RepID=A0ABR4NH02_9FUNG
MLATPVDGLPAPAAARLHAKTQALAALAGADGAAEETTVAAFELAEMVVGVPDLLCQAPLVSALLDWLLDMASDEGSRHSAAARALFQRLFVARFMVPCETALKISLATGHTIHDFVRDFLVEAELAVVDAFERLRDDRLEVKSAEIDALAKAFGDCALALQPHEHRI